MGDLALSRIERAKICLWMYGEEHLYSEKKKILEANDWLTIEPRARIKKTSSTQRKKKKKGRERDGVGL